LNSVEYDTYQEQGQPAHPCLAFIHIAGGQSLSLPRFPGSATDEQAVKLCVGDDALCEVEKDVTECALPARQTEPREGLMGLRADKRRPSHHTHVMDTPHPVTLSAQPFTVPRRPHAHRAKGRMGFEVLSALTPRWRHGHAAGRRAALYAACLVSCGGSVSRTRRRVGTSVGVGGDATTPLRGCPTLTP
jgi:hypothetical protein